MVLNNTKGTIRISGTSELINKRVEGSIPPFELDDKRIRTRNIVAKKKISICINADVCWHLAISVGLH